MPETFEMDRFLLNTSREARQERERGLCPTGIPQQCAAGWCRAQAPASMPPAQGHTFNSSLASSLITEAKYFFIQLKGFNNHSLAALLGSK